MSTKTKLEKDYQRLNKAIEKLAEAEIKKIRKKTNDLKLEAEKTGKAIEVSIEEAEEKTGEQKKLIPSIAFFYWSLVVLKTRLIILFLLLP